MAFLNILRIAVVATLLFTSVSGAAVGATCTNPKVRKEWRSISSDERAAWIDGIKVSSLSVQVPSSLPDIGNSSVSPNCRMIPRSFLPSTLRFR